MQAHSVSWEWTSSERRSFCDGCQMPLRCCLLSWTGMCCDRVLCSPGEGLGPVRTPQSLYHNILSPQVYIYEGVSDYGAFRQDRQLIRFLLVPGILWLCTDSSVQYSNLVSNTADIYKWPCTRGCGTRPVLHVRKQHSHCCLWDKNFFT